MLLHFTAASVSPTIRELSGIDGERTRLTGTGHAEFQTFPMAARRQPLSLPTIKQTTPGIGLPLTLRIAHAIKAKYESTEGRMSFNVEIAPRRDARGAIVHAVLVTIDGHETVLNFVSKDDAESFARDEHARLTENEKNISQRVREIAYYLWQEEGCPEGEALRHWFAAKAVLDSEGATAPPRN